MWVWVCENWVYKPTYWVIISDDELNREEKGRKREIRAEEDKAGILLCTTLLELYKEREEKNFAYLLTS